MACPFFYPTIRADESAWAIAPRLPLGDAYQGECRAAVAAFVPEPSRVQDTCNTGYARGCCERFPQDARADAVRFHVVEETAQRIIVQFTLEKECWPAGDGTLEYSLSEGRFKSQESELMRAQASSFIASYLRRRASF